MGTKLTYLLSALALSRSVSSGTIVQTCRSDQAVTMLVALHSYAFDCVTHHLFHPYGSSSLQSQQDEAVMREITLDDSLQSEW